MSTFFLPPTIAISTNFWGGDASYWNYSDDTDSGESGQGHLRLNGQNVFSRSAKFEVVTANTGRGLVHLRCSHNRKFLRRRAETLLNMTPDADEPEEDQSKWSCTLFEPQRAEDGNNTRFMLLHVQSKDYARAWSNYAGIRLCRIGVSDASAGIFNVTDVDSLVILPRYVAFKGQDGRYLRNTGTHQPFRFQSTDMGNSESWFEVFTDEHGMVRITSQHDNSHFSPNLNAEIFALPDAGTLSSGLFQPVKVDGNTVALKNIRRNRFCSHQSASGSLFANEIGITLMSRLTLEELVLSRRIYNMDFDFANAIIYGETPVTMATANSSNNTAAENTVEFRFAHTESQSNTWTSSHSWMVGIEIQISARIPFGLGGIQNTYTAQYNGSIEWGETITTETTLETTYTATVPANTSISVSLMATKGYCDVPYSYYQRDVLYNGETVVYKKEDGLYKGISSYNFRYEVTTLAEPKSKAELSTIEQKLPIPLVDPSIQQKVPLPLPFGSTTVRTLVSSTSATTAEKKLSSLQLDDATSSMPNTLA